MKGKVKKICWDRSPGGARRQLVILNQTKDKKVWALGDYSVVFNLTQGVTSVMIMRGDLTIDPSPCLTSPAHFHDPFWMHARIFSYNVCIIMSHVDTLYAQGSKISGIIWVVGYISPQRGLQPVSVKKYTLERPPVHHREDTDIFLSFGCGRKPE